MGKKAGAFIGVVLIGALLVLVAFTGADLGFVYIPSAEQGVKLGLDLVGGSTILFEAEIPEGTSGQDVNDGMEGVVQTIRARLGGAGYTEANINRVGDRQVRVEIPNVRDPEAAVALVGTTGELSFRDADGNILLRGDSVQSATVEYGATGDSTSAVRTSDYHVVLTFKPDARAIFTEATKKAAARASEGKNYIAIFMDEDVQSTPYVDAKYASTGIDSDSCIVTLGANENQTQAEAAKQFADLINGGRLPFKLVQKQLSAVGAQLGAQSLSTSLLAGIIGLILVILFMIFMYRIPGALASIALIFYVGLVALILAIAGVNLSLPGIAGIILGIGMAVDANVIIFERMKEELRSGKTIRSSVTAGYARALTAIIDSNVTTLIAAGVLWWQGTGPIRGFAVTLFIGVVVSMFTVLVVTRILLNSILGLKVKSLKAFGV